MLYSARKIDGWKLIARDGEIGQAREVYVDDQRWVIRHVVVDTGGWLFGRKVLISPHAIQRLDSEHGRM
ncbi:MAG TPA: PRC-barrel domain-containing protein, partial [Rubrivivax sp.]|nr:PRC-barrel domain-containing protein [Rubrivivax sp.]